MRASSRYCKYFALIGVALSASSGAGAQIFAAAPPPASRPVPARPSAELKVFSSSSQKVKWPGAGPNAISFDLCVASTTGRYRLQVASQSGGAMLGAGSKLRFSIRFRDASGVEQVKSLNGQALIFFEGSAPSQQDCSSGANSTIEIDNSEGDMLAQVAGDYADRLLLSAEPL